MKFWKACFPLIIFCVFLAGCDSQPGDSRAKFCATDYAVLMRDSAVGKEGAKAIENLQNSLQKELDALQEKVEKNPQDQKAMQEFQQSYSLIQQRLQNDAQNVAGQIMQFIDSQLEAYRKSKGYEAIIALEALYAYDPAMDRTGDIIAWLDSQKDSFKLSLQQAANPETQHPAPAPAASPETEKEEAKK